jgi:hypothetical protein
VDTTLSIRRPEAKRPLVFARFFFTIPRRKAILCRIHRLSGINNSIPAVEDSMKLSVTLLCFALVGALVLAMPAGAQKKDAPAAAKETKWQGYVVRIDKDHSMIDLRGGKSPSKSMRKVSFDSSTQWTKLGKPAKQDDVKEESFVIVMGTPDDSGVLHATRIDLRLPR